MTKLTADLTPDDLPSICGICFLERGQTVTAYTRKEAKQHVRAEHGWLKDRDRRLRAKWATGR